MIDPDHLSDRIESLLSIFADCQMAGTNTANNTAAGPSSSVANSGNDHVNNNENLTNDIIQDGRRSSIIHHDDRFYQIELDNSVMSIPKRYENLRKIGYGAQGFVCSAYDAVEKRDVAIKKLNRPFSDVTQAKRAYRELKLLKSVNHKNVIGLLNAFTPQRTLKEFTDFYIVMEFMDGNLSQVVRADLNHDRISYLVYQMLCGVRYLHAVGISHRDLKPSNLGATTQCTLKILDFGLARCGAANNFMKTQYVVTRYYRAPEVILGMDYDERVDIWSIGCCFGELIRKTIIFPGMDHADQYTKIVTLLGTPPASFLDRLQPGVRTYLQEKHPYQKGYTFEELFPDQTFPEEQDNSLWANAQRAAGVTNPKKACELARDLLSKMLVIDPDHRISIDEALQHPYVTVWLDETDQIKPAPVQYDQTIEEQDYTIQRWKELVFAELVDYAQSHNVYGDAGGAGEAIMDSS